MLANETPRVLVADDEKTIALTLTEILFREGYRVATCFSGEEAVEKAAEFLPDLFLSDISMGRMNGVEAAARITAKLPSARSCFIPAISPSPVSLITSPRTWSIASCQSRLTCPICSMPLPACCPTRTPSRIKLMRTLCGRAKQVRELRNF